MKSLLRTNFLQDPRVAAFIILDDVIADQKIIRYNADLQRFFVEGRHLAITVFIASQYLKGVGPMIRNNCDYIYLQPIYNKTQRDVIWDLEAAFMKKDEFNVLLDQVIERKLLPGNCAQEPKKQVRIMVRSVLLVIDPVPTSSGLTCVRIRCTSCDRATARACVQ